MKPLEIYDKVIGRQPGLYGPLHGAGPAAVGRAVLGAGIGYGAGKLFGGTQKTKRNLALGGAVASLVPSGLDMATMHGLGKGMNDPFPYAPPVQSVQPVSPVAPPKVAKDLSWVGVQIPGHLRKRIREMAKGVADEDLVPAKIKNYGQGREMNPHVTVLYGLRTKDPKKVEPVVKGKYPRIPFRLGAISTFEKPDYDVLKIDVHSGDRLKGLYNHLKSNLPNADVHPTYHPHVTLAYLRKGVAQKYVGSHPLRDQKVEVNKVRFSTSDRDNTDIKLATAMDTMAEIAPAQYSPVYFPFEPGQDHISVNGAANAVLADPKMSLSQKAVAFDVLSKAADGRDSGLITKNDLVRGALGAGMGYVAAQTMGRVLGAVFGLDRTSQRRLSQAGALGGLFNSL